MVGTRHYFDEHVLYAQRLPSLHSCARTRPRNRHVTLDVYGTYWRNGQDVKNLQCTLPCYAQVDIHYVLRAVSTVSRLLVVVLLIRWLHTRLPRPLVEHFVAAGEFLQQQLTRFRATARGEGSAAGDQGHRSRHELCRFYWSVEFLQTIFANVCIDWTHAYGRSAASVLVFSWPMCLYCRSATASVPLANLLSRRQCGR